MSKSGRIGRPLASRGGQGRAMRNSPLSRSREWEARSPWGRSGQLEPSTAANRGSSAPLSCQRLRADAADRLMPSAGWWHVTQARPFGPKGSKNGWPRVSIGPPSSSSRSLPEGSS